MTSALDRWKTAGLVEVQLPSGFKVRGVLPTVEMLLLRGSVPGTLTEIALRFATTGVNLTDSDTETASKFMLFAREMAAGFVRDVWNDETSEWEPVTITAADFDGTFDQLDIDALEDLALRQKSAAQISERIGGPGPIAAWTDFRGEVVGAGVGVDGSEVRVSPEQPSGHRGPGGGVRARRGAGGPSRRK